MTIEDGLVKIVRKRWHKLFDDDEILEEISSRYGISISDVVRSRQISEDYDKEHQKRKQKQKLKAQEEAARKEREEYRRNNPDLCFCVEDGLEVDHKYDEGDEIVGYYMAEVPPYFDATRKERRPYFKCTLCGKKYKYPPVTWA